MAHHFFGGHGGDHGTGQAAPPPVSANVQPAHTGAGGPYHQEPSGPLVTVVSEANRNYRLTSRDDGVVLAYKNQQDPKQVQMHFDIVLHLQRTVSGYPSFHIATHCFWIVSGYPLFQIC